jgi:hypothetical protein
MIKPIWDDALSMVTAQSYDKLNRLQTISNRAFAAGGIPATSLPLSTTYTYNSENQRSMAHGADGSYWVYQYDALGQMTSGAFFPVDNRGHVRVSRGRREQQLLDIETERDFQKSSSSDFTGFCSSKR